MNTSLTPLNNSFSDIHFCSPYFSRNPISDLDCIHAFSLLPLIDKPKKFKTHVPPGTPYGLPLTVSHGTCAMKFETAGRSADRLDSVLFIPKQVGEMAERVMNKCVGGAREGGFVTAGIANTENFLGDPSVDADFAGGFRESQFNPVCNESGRERGGLTYVVFPPEATSTTFFNLLLWNPEIVDYSAFNPGDHDPQIGGTLEKYTRFAVEKQAAGSESRGKLEERAEYIGNAVKRMSRTLGATPLVNWWDGGPPGLSLPGGNGTDSACNTTLVRALDANCSDLVRPVEAS